MPSHDGDILKNLNDFAFRVFGFNLELENSSSSLEAFTCELSKLEQKINLAQTPTPSLKQLEIKDKIVLNILDAAPDGMVAIDEQGKIVLFNKSAETLFGYNKEEILGNRLEILMPTQYNHNHNHHVIGYFNKPSTRPMGAVGRDMFARKKDGTHFPVDISLSYIDTPEGKIAISAIRDITKTQKINDAIRESERKLKDITATIPGIVYQFKVLPQNKFEFTFLSEGAAEIWGVTPEDVYKDGNLPFTKIHKDDLPAVFESMNASNLSGQSINIAFRINAADGQIKWMQSSTIPSIDKDGIPIRSGCILDITNIKLVEQDLIESELFNNSLLSSLTAQIAVVDKQGTIIATNKTWDDFYNEHGETILPRLKQGQNLFDLYATESETADTVAKEALAAINTVLYSTSKPIQIPYSCILNGEQRWFYLRVMKFVGDVPKVILVHSDISDINKSELLLKQNKEKYKTILDTTDEMINTLSPDGKIVWANNAWKKNLGFVDADFENLRLRDILPDEIIPGFNDRFMRLKSGETILGFKANMITKKGIVINVAGSLVPIFEEGEFVGSQAFLRNVTEINRERAERLKAESRLQKTLDNMVSGCMIVGFDWKYLYVNRAAGIQSFSNPEELIGRTMQEMFPGVEGSTVFASYKKVMDGRIALEFEDKYSFPNGITRWFEFKVEPTEEGIFVITVDVTDKKEAQDKINKHKDILSESQRIAQIGSWELDLVNNELFWTEEAYRIFGINPNLFDATYEGFLAIVHPDDRDFVHDSYSSSVKYKTGYDIVHRIMSSDGKIKYLHEQAKTYYNEEGQPIRSIGTVHDITRQKEAELIIHQNEQKYQQVVENISDGLMVRDMNGKILFANQRFLDLYGLEESDLDTIYLGDLIAPEHRDLMVERHYRRFRGEVVPDQFEFLALRKDGEKRWFETRQTENIENGRVVSVQTIARDITERKLADEERTKIIKDLVNRNKDLEQFTYIVSHNLRAPVANIIGITNIVNDVTMSFDQKTSFLDALAVSVNRMDDVIRDLNNILQVRNNLNETKMSLKFRDIITDIKLSLGSLISANDIVILTDFKNVEGIHAIKSYIYSVFYNLVSNSIKFRRPNVKLLVEVKSNHVGNSLVLKFTDNGLGIDLSTKGDQIFGLYKRFHRHIEGKGMGLFMVKTQVESMGGIISVESKVGIGTTFTIEFPYT